MFQPKITMAYSSKPDHKSVLIFDWKFCDAQYYYISEFLKIRIVKLNNISFSYWGEEDCIKVLITVFTEIF